MVGTPQQTVDVETARPRIVQYQRRRYSIRLEPIFWRGLEQLADRAGLRLGEYIARLANHRPKGNFSSYLRVHCMEATEEKIAAQDLRGDYGSLLTVMRAAPTPGLILSRYRSIIGVNDAFKNWIGPTEVSLTGANLTSLIQVRTREPLNDVWQKMLSGRQGPTEARVLYVAPGRVNAAQASFIPLLSSQGDEFYALMWLTVNRAVQKGNVLRRAIKVP